MITAIEARIRSNVVTGKDLDERLTTVYQLIEVACDYGKRVVYTDKPLEPELCDRLKGLGYRIGQYNDPVEGWTQIAW